MTIPDGLENCRPPLSTQLFGNRRIFVEAMVKFKDCMGLISGLRQDSFAVEKTLAKVQEQGRKYPRVAQELAAVRYYLHFSIYACQNEWRQFHKGITNYATLLREIDRWRYEFSEEVCFVTFNYDTMLEEAMDQVLKIKFPDLASYIAVRDYALFKVHGSIDWGIEMNGYNRHGFSPGDEYSKGSIPTRDTYQFFIDHAASINLSSRYRKTSHYPMYLEGDVFLFPAVAIPVENKDECVCPADHVEALGKRLQKVNKIITIGWRATEDKFVSMLTPMIQGNTHFMIVTGTQDGAKATFQNIGGRAHHVSKLIGGGFTSLIKNLSDLDAFLRNP